MGFTPEQIDRMFIFEFGACAKGYARSQGVKDGPPQGDGMSEDRMRDLGLL